MPQPTMPPTAAPLNGPRTPALLLATLREISKPTPAKKTTTSRRNSSTTA